MLAFHSEHSPVLSEHAQNHTTWHLHMCKHTHGTWFLHLLIHLCVRFHKILFKIFLCSLENVKLVNCWICYCLQNSHTVSAPRLTLMPSHNTQTLTGNVSSLQVTKYPPAPSLPRYDRITWQNGGREGASDGMRKWHWRDTGVWRC